MKRSKPAGMWIKLVEEGSKYFLLCGKHRPMPKHSVWFLFEFILISTDSPQTWRIHANKQRWLMRFSSKKSIKTVCVTKTNTKVCAWIHTHICRHAATAHRVFCLVNFKGIELSTALHQYAVHIKQQIGYFTCAGTGMAEPKMSWAFVYQCTRVTRLHSSTYIISCGQKSFGCRFNGA